MAKDNILTRERGPGKRLSDDRRAAETGQMTEEQLEFLKAVEQYKIQRGKRFLTHTEYLEIAKALGYRKVCDG